MSARLLAQTAGFVGAERARRLAFEGRTAVDGLRADEWPRVLAFCASAAAVGTVWSKVRGIRALASGVGEMTQRAVQHVRDVGVREAVADLPGSASAVLRVGTSLARDRWDEWRTLPAEAQRALVSDVLVAGLTAYLVAGGADLEGGLPDTDLLFGVGNHRNPFSHTFLVALSAEVCIRFAAASISLLHARLPAEHDPIWDRALDTYNRTYEAAIVGVWFGTAGHLLKDAGLPWGPTKTLSGLPVTLTMAGHKMLLATSGVVSGATGVLQAAGRKQAYTRATLGEVDSPR